VIAARHAMRGAFQTGHTHGGCGARKGIAKMDVLHEWKAIASSHVRHG
jgi:hypothetical protein